MSLQQRLHTCFISRSGRYTSAHEKLPRDVSRGHVAAFMGIPRVACHVGISMQFPAFQLQRFDHSDAPEGGTVSTAIPSLAGIRAEHGCDLQLPIGSLERRI